MKKESRKFGETLPSNVTKAGSLREEGEVSDTSQFDEKILGVEPGLFALNRRLVVFENNFTSVKTVALEGLNEVTSNLEEFEEVNKEGLTNFELKLIETLSSLHREFETLKRQVDETATAGVAGPVTVRETRIEGPKPKEFRGERNAQDVENFLWQMDAYFEHVCMTSEAAKIQTTIMYLSDTAMLWWRRKNADMERGVCIIDDWEQFKGELKRQFYPQNVVHEARRKLRDLKQTSFIRDYVKEFTRLILQIPSLTSEDLLFYFLDGLQNCDVDKVIVVAESLTDFWADTANGRDNRSKNVPPKGDSSRNKNKSVPNQGSDTRGNNRNQHFNLHIVRVVIFVVRQLTLPVIVRH
ncbi:hypothetical protein KY289_016853 [Solanum tuberosum]|nr:hypothetical protein KY289_016853 [Solanum tuberosum]